MQHKLYGPKNKFFKAKENTRRCDTLKSHQDILKQSSTLSGVTLGTNTSKSRHYSHNISY